MKPIIVAGPTASGKTALGIQLAKRLGGAVISADSRMVYRRLDIGTGKPTWEYRTLTRSPWIPARLSSKLGIFHPDRDGIFQIRTPANRHRELGVKLGPVYSIDGVDHYGLDLVEPEAKFTLTDWLAFARPLVSDLTTRRVQPVVVGGTGLYLKALFGGFVPPPTDPTRRVIIEQLSTDEIIGRLAELDPVSVERANGNRRRLIRALEVVELTGRPFSDPQNGVPIEAVVIALEVDRAELYRRIDQRLAERLQAGLIDEVQCLLASGVSADWLRSLGLEYRFVAGWLLDSFKQSQQGLVRRRVALAAAIHRYARRQLTYLRHQLPVHWVRSTDEALALIRG